MVTCDYAWLQWQDGTCDHYTCKRDAEVEIVAGVDAYTEVANEYPVFDSIEKCDSRSSM